MRSAVFFTSISAQNDTFYQNVVRGSHLRIGIYSVRLLTNAENQCKMTLNLMKLTLGSDLCFFQASHSYTFSYRVFYLFILFYFENQRLYRMFFCFLQV